MMPPLAPFHAVAVRLPPLAMVTSVHWGTRCTITFCPVSTEFDVVAPYNFWISVLKVSVFVDMDWISRNS